MTVGSLSGATVLVAGASGGIGRGVAIAAAQAGAARLILVGRDPGRLAHVAVEVTRAGAIADAESVDLAAGHLPHLPDRLDLLVHALGAHALAPLAGTDAAMADAMWATNARAPLLLTRAATPALEAADGMAVFVNSSQGLAAGRNAAAYAASKHALRAVADSVRAEVGARGVRVLSVYPGRTDTLMQRALLATEGRAPDPARLLRPEDVAAMIIAAASLPKNAEVTDITIRPARPY
jgi:NADP-dependent 3-hydroxy acid dehydrogenase YdfG